MKVGEGNALDGPSQKMVEFYPGLSDSHVIRAPLPRKRGCRATPRRPATAGR